MPPVVVTLLGAAAAAVAAKLLSFAMNKVNADLDRLRREEENHHGDVAKLERDPVTGKYRPAKS